MLSFRALDGIVHATWRAQDDATGEDKRAAAASSSPDAVAASLAGDAAVRTARAELLFSRGDSLAAYRECCAIVAADSRATECMNVYLACMVELGKRNELFQLGHRCAACVCAAMLACSAPGC